MTSRNQSTDTIVLRSKAAWTIGTVMVGHILLETGVDATFLANASVDRLPIVIILVAILAVAIARVGGAYQHRTVLIALQAIAALGTLVFWLLVGESIPWSYYVLFVWSGVIGSLVVVRFWLLLGDLFTIGEGKRGFATIAMGGSIGALVGSAIGAAVAPIIGGEGMLLASAAAYGLSVWGAMSLPSADTAALSHDDTATAGLIASFQALIASRYASRIAMLVVVGGITLTFGDFLFKSVLTAEVASEDLAVWLSRIYLGLNLLSIMILAIGVTPIVRRVGVDRSLVVLPMLVGGAALGVMAGAALGATIFLKAMDGTLRYSLHKTASELLYLPMTSALRTSVKGAIDIVGQAGAKAFASIVILALLLSPSPRLAISLAVVISSAFWVWLALRLRQPYLDMFRHSLREGSIETIVAHPELDLESVGSWIQALSHPDKDRSIAAMRLLAERGHEQLIPNLILYHPAPEVAAHAMDLFAKTRRRGLAHLLDRLVDHEYAEVRAASVRAKWAIEKDYDGLHELARASCPVVRVSALAGLLAAGKIDSDALTQTLNLVSTDDWCSSRMAAATAARLHYDPVYREVLLRLVSDVDLGVAREAIRAIRESSDEWFIPGLVDLLTTRGVRTEIRNALIGYGDKALSVLASRLVDRNIPTSLRAHIPVTLAHFDRKAAGTALREGLPKVDSGMVRFKILCGFEMLVRRATEIDGLRRDALSKDEVTVIEAEFERTLASTGQRLDVEIGLADWQRFDPAKATAGGELLVDLLRDKRALAVGRLFKMIGLTHPADDFRAIQSGLLGPDKQDRASAAELVETLLSSEVSSGLIELTTYSTRADQSLDGGPATHQPSTDYESFVANAVQGTSDSVRAVARYHAAELELSSVVALGDQIVGSERPTGSKDAAESDASPIQDFFDRHATMRTSTAH